MIISILAVCPSDVSRIQVVTQLLSESNFDMFGKDVCKCSVESHASHRALSQKKAVMNHGRRFDTTRGLLSTILLLFLFDKDAGLDTN